MGTGKKKKQVLEAKIKTSTTCPMCKGFGFPFDLEGTEEKPVQQHSINQPFVDLADKIKDAAPPTEPPAEVV
jgi:hypothetical protein